jgi:phosphohistidine phosphatase SixA
MRHASAGERLESPVEDRARGLDAVGRADARTLPSVLGEHRIERIVSSPTVRCLASVVLLGRRLGIDVECREELGPDASRKDVLSVLGELPENTLVCTHGEVFERLFKGEVTCEKGGTWLIERKGRRRVPVAYLPPSSSSTARRVRRRRATRARYARSS